MNRPTVLITGALTGIGRATALAFAGRGANVVVSGRHEDTGLALAAELRTLGAAAEFVAADVTNESDVEALVDRAASRFGTIDIAVNNAGTEGTLGPVTAQTVENYHATFSTNVLGTLLCLKHEMRIMVARGRGSIVNLSSIAGRVGVAGGSVYAASKHAVEGLTRCAALEGAAAGVRVNAIAPGPVTTDMLDRFVGRNDAVKAGFLAGIPAKRAASADEIAEMIVCIASTTGTYLTGQSIAVDGGYTAQ